MERRTSADLLSGVRVVELAPEPSLPLALTAKLYADLGADVTVVRAASTVDPNAPGPVREWHYLLHDLLRAGTRQVPAPAGPEWLADASVAALVRGADIVLAPPYPGLDRAAVRAVNPTAVHGVLSPFGPEGAGWRSSDLVVQALGGMLASTGQPGEPPTKVGARVGDQLGALYLGVGCLAGLIRRRRTGAGQAVAVSQVEALVSALTNFIAEYFGRGSLPEPLGNRHLASSPWNLYPAADGYVVICLITDRKWDQLAELIGRPELAGHPDYQGQHNRRPRADHIDRLVTGWTATRPVGEILRILGDLGIPCSDVPFTDTVLREDETIARRGLITRLPGGGIALGPIVQLAEMVAGAPVVPGPGPFTPQSGSGGERPLDGLRVVEIGLAAAGPVAGRILANLGADVIKIEPPAGEIGRRVPPQIGTTSAVFQLNCSEKRSLCLDIATEPGQSAARRVAATADVIVENLSPGRLASWGLGFAQVAAANPGVVYTSVTGFGQANAGTRVRAYDTVVQAASGLLRLTGWPDGVPTKAGISLSDFFSGVTGAFATLAALTAAQADRSAGEVRATHVDVAMFDATVWTTLSAWPQVILHGARPARAGNGDRYVRWQGLVTCRDGLAAVTLHDEADETALAALAGPVGGADGDPPATDGPQGILDGWAAGRTVAEVVDALRGAGLAAGAVRGIAEIADDPALRARGVVDTVIHPVDGTVPAMNTPIRIDGVDLTVRAASPVLGAHTREILRTVAGYSATEIDELVAHPTVIQA